MTSPRLKTLRPILDEKREPRPLWRKDAERGNRHQRGYGTAWEKLREQIIERDKGLCQPCLRNDLVTKFDAVDHITPKARARLLGWTQEQIDHPQNLQCICDPCHDAKSRTEMTPTPGGGGATSETRSSLDPARAHAQVFFPGSEFSGVEDGASGPAAGAGSSGGGDGQASAAAFAGALPGEAA